MKLALRASQIANQGNRRTVIELIVINGRWYIIIDNGTQLEDLGEQ